MSRLRKPLLLLVLLGTLSLTGCVAFLLGSPSAAQRDVIGSVEITSAICVSDTEETEHLGCAADDVAGGDPNGNGDVEVGGAPQTLQSLTAYRVPEGSSGPTSFTTDTQPGPTPLTYQRNASYEAELERLLPSGTAQRWVAYVSAPFPYDADASMAAADHRVTFSPAFSLPRPAGGAPFRGPFAYQQVIGGRSVTNESPASRPVTCGPSAAGFGPGNTFCASQPAAATFANNTQVPVRDLGLVAVAPVMVAAGRAADARFNVQFAGTAVAGTTSSLTAATTVPGVSVTPSQGTVTPGTNSTTPVSVRLSVPRGTAPGNYAVTLTARLANGQVRVGSVPVTVTDATKPRASASLVKGQSIRSMLKRGVRVRVRMNEAGRVTSELLGSSGFLAANKVLGKKTTRFSRAQTKTVRIKLGKKARRKKARRKFLAKKKIKLVVRNKARDSAGNRRTTRKAIRLKR